MDNDNTNSSTTEINKIDNISLRKKILNSIHGFIFDLPFENYRKYYKTGIIQKMTKEEKKKFFINMNIEDKHRKIFTRLLVMRPEFLDDTDLFDYRQHKSKVFKYQLLAFSLFFLNWSYYSFNFLVKQKRELKFFLLRNTFVILSIYYTTGMTEFKQKELFYKYKHVMTQDSLINLMKSAYRID